MADEAKSSTSENVGKGIGSAFSKAGPVIIVLGLGAVGIYFLYQWLMEGFFGKAKAFENALSQAMSDYARKMISYNEVTNGNLTEGQLTSETSELKAIEGLGNQLANAYGTFDGLILFAEKLVAGIVVAAFLEKVVAKYIKGGYVRGPQDPPPPNCMRTFYGQTMTINMMMADQMIALGNTVGATNLVNTMTAHYNSTIQPGMENQIISIQTEINSGLLIGTQLMIAQQTIAAISYDMAFMPTLIAFPLVILP